MSYFRFISPSYERLKFKYESFLERKAVSENSTNLGVIIGSILSDVSKAKKISDQTSSRLAKEYHADDLLKLFPVPHTHLKKFDVTIKFAIKSVQSESDDHQVGIVVDFDSIKDISLDLLNSINISGESNDSEWEDNADDS